MTIVSGLGRECHSTMLWSLGNMLQIQRSTKDVPKSISTGRVSTTANKAHTWSSPIFTNRRKIPSVCIDSFVAVWKLVESASFIWSCHNEGKIYLLIKFGPALMSSKLADVWSVLYRMPMEIRMLYMVRRKKNPTWSRSLSYFISSAYGPFDGGPRNLVVGVLWEALSLLLLLKRRKVLGALTTAAMTFVTMTIVDFSWSTSSGGRSKFSKDPARLPIVFSFLERTWRNILKAVSPAMV